MTDQEQINSLKAQVNCLRHCLEQARNDKDKEAFERCYGKTLAMTSNQCLAEVKAKAIEDYKKEQAEIMRIALSTKLMMIS